MIFTILITIVFIAELIITISVILNLLKLDKAVLELNNTIEIINPKIKEVCTLGRKISYQLKELSLRFIEKVKDERENPSEYDGNTECYLYIGDTIVKSYKFEIIEGNKVTLKVIG